MTRDEIEKALMDQLVDMGADTAHFRDLIRDYMSLWDIKNKLILDIDLRDVSFETRSASGNPVTKNNPSVRDLLNVNKQMLNLLKELEIHTSTVYDPASEM